MEGYEFDNFVLAYSPGEWIAIRKRNLENSKLSATNQSLSEERNMINQKSKFDQNWKLIRGQSVEWWSLLAEHDLKKVDKANDKQGKFVTLLQVKYGYTRQRAQEEINNRWMAFYMARKIAG
jgi:hypothetical protein